MITTVLFNSSKIHIVLHCRVQSCHAFTRLRHASPSCRELCQACALSRGWGESNMRRTGLARAERHHCGREAISFENVITDYHLLSLSGHEGFAYRNTEQLPNCCLATGVVSCERIEPPSAVAGGCFSNSCFVATESGAVHTLAPRARWFRSRALESCLIVLTRFAFRAVIA